MNVTIKQRILMMVSIIALCSLLGCIVLMYNAANIGEKLKLETENHIKAMIGRNAEKIESTMRVMEKNVDDLATTGEVFYSVYKRTGRDVTHDIKHLLIDNFEKASEAIGGGLWFEPNIFFEKKHYYGPYVYREGDRVVFTWEMNTPEYDYHNQGWYRLAVPHDWDRNQRRPKSAYWTDPYIDEAGSGAPMITVDAVMYDHHDKILGVATVDLSLAYLKQMVNEMRVTPNSVAFAIDMTSRLFISFPTDPAKVMKRTAAVWWGEEIEAARDTAHGKVVVNQLSLGDNTYSLFYTMTKSGKVLGILAPHKELYAELQRLGRANMIISFVVIALQLFMCLLISLIMIRRISSPISRLTNVVQEVAGGNIFSASRQLARVSGSTSAGKDETGRLLGACESMTLGLSSLVGQMKKSGNQVTESSSDIATSSRQLEATVTEQAASTRQVSAASKQISDTAAKLATTMKEVASAASETAELADTGQEGLKNMKTSMQGVLNASEIISEKLNDINHKAANIETIVTTINKVSEQTNLLSLNASIEAEKAGEYGAGFFVVAREIRRLADQTAVAVLDIEAMVGKMQSSVATGVLEMERFSNEVQADVKQIAQVSKQLDGIMERIRNLRPRFEAVNVGMEAQSESALQISETMEQLNVTTQSTAESLRGFKHTTQQLNEAARRLQDEVSRFKIT